MRIFFILLLPSLSLAASNPPTAFPVFLKPGFSSVLEFDDTPTRVILGDSQSFQVEKLEHSLAVRTVATHAATNMFVYFKNAETRLFLLSASEDSQPTFYKKFEAPPKEVVGRPARDVARPQKKSGLKLVSAQFDSKKDYLTVDVLMTADSRKLIKPRWEGVRLAFGGTSLPPLKLWAERQEVQRDSDLKARFIFVKPNVPRALRGVSLLVPVYDSAVPFDLSLSGRAP